MSKTRGFTLMELMVVIAIIGILAAIILVSVAGARDQSRDATRAAGAKQLEGAMEVYYAEHGGYPTSDGSGNGDVLINDPKIVAALAPYMPIPSLLISDSDHYYGGY